jgi:ABC-type branched-subunit amino acid transport system substrate-binding protein
MRRGEKPGPPWIIDVGLQMAQGLAAAHDKGLIHRDVKPSNVWLEGDPGASATRARRVKILDFGLARPVENAAGLTQIGVIMGTPAYMAPEQAEGKGVDARSDLFSLGCVLYELASGQQPFTGATPFAVLTATVLRDPRPPHLVNPGCPAVLSALIVQLLAKRPEERPATAHAVVEALEALAADQPLPRTTPRSGLPLPTPVKLLPPPPPPRRRRGVYLLAALAVLLLGGAVTAWLLWRNGRQQPRAERPVVQGVSDDEVVLGMSAPFSGPAAELGIHMRRGIQLCFKRVNDDGGVAGRRLRLESLDDGYEPDRALKNVRELDERDRVFGFVGNVGTPTALQTLPYVLERKMLFFGAFTGAHVLRKEPPDRYVFNFRASYAEETEAAVKYLVGVRKVPPKQIAVFAQADGYGDSGFRGVVRALGKFGLGRHDILRVGYPRNTVQVDGAAEEIIRRKDIRGVVMVPTYRPAARFVQLVKKERRDVIFTSASFVDAAALGEELRQYGPRYPEGVVVTQVVPPVDSQASVIIRFRKLMADYFPRETPNSLSLEGYITAELLVEGLRRAGDELTTETLVDALESIRDLDLGIGTPLSFGPSRHQASDKVWAIMLDAKGHATPLDLE